MKPRRANLVGQTFGRLTVLEFAGINHKGGATWHCRCACGGHSTPSTGSLRDGNSTSCGCIAKEKRRAAGHLMSTTTEYRIWTLMRSRCTNPRTPNFHRYGGRGITVCEQWEDFRAFLRDMGPRPSLNHSLDRRNNDGPYAPENCRWATRAEQAANTSANRRFVVDGQPLILRDIAARAGINASTLYYRLKRGLTMDEALSRPLHERHG